MEIERFLHEYRQVRTHKPLARGTKELYGHCLRRLESFLAKRGIALLNLTVAQFEEFLGTQPWGSSSRYTALAAVKAFLLWLKLGEDDHPLCKHALPRDPAGPQPTPKHNELEKLFKSIDRRAVAGKRDFLAALLAQECGLRAKEMANLQQDLFDLENMEFTVVVKGGLEWVTPFPESVKIAAERWIPARDRIAVEGTTTLFVALNGTRKVDGIFVSALGYPMTRHGIKEMFYRMTENAGIERYSPHAFRRSFCTEAVMRNVNLRLIQLQGRWKSIGMVVLYSQAATAQAFRGHFGGFGEV